MTVPTKVSRTMEWVKAQDNNVTLEVDERKYGTAYRVRFESLEDHPLLQSRGSLTFYRSKSHGRTRFHGGYLFPGIGSMQDFKTYADMRIVISVYTPTPLSEGSQS